MLRDCFQPAFLLLRELKIPTAASAQGLAHWRGMSLALTCDLTLVAESAYFQAAFVNLGIVPDTGSSWLLLE